MVRRRSVDLFQDLAQTVASRPKPVRTTAGDLYRPCCAQRLNHRTMQPSACVSFLRYRLHCGYAARGHGAGAEQDRGLCSV
jgi:hypothetical protein